MLATMLPSHDGDGAAKVTCTRCDIVMSHAGDNVAESCWRRCCQRDLHVTQCRCLVMLATMLPSYASNDAAEGTWPRHDVDI
jgi:hypothetical protein